MPAITLIITAVGRAALINAASDGTNAVRIASAGLTAAAFIPTAAQVVVPGEFARIAGLGGSTVDADTISLIIRDDSANAYTLRGFGLFLTDGTLFAIYGQPTPILEKSVNSTALIAVDVRFADINAATLTFGNTNFLQPPATTVVQGVIELATNAETIGGIDPVRAVVPSGLKAMIDDRFGAGSPSGFVRGLLTAATAAALHLAIGLRSAALKDEGPGNGLNADLLDGFHAHAATTGPAWSTVPTVGSGGVMDIGHAIDFHAVASEPADFTLRLRVAGGNLLSNDAVVWTTANDGAGSGLDADTVDGVQAASFLRGDVPGGWTLATAAVGSTAESGSLVLRELNFALAGSGLISSAPRLSFLWAARTGAQLALNAGGYLEILDFGGNSGPLRLSNLTATGTITAGGQTVWNAGNDGAGSGLDADLLDGQQGAFYTAIAARLGYTPYNAANPAGYISGINSAMVTGALGYTPWHAGNDGSGSGLDADLLDGRDSSSFYAASNPAAYISGINDAMVVSALGYVPLNVDSFADRLLDNNGWQRIPGGRLENWGQFRGYVGSETTRYVPFPKPFTEACYVVMTTAINPTSSGSRDSIAQIVARDVNGFTVFIQNPGGQSNLDGFDWFAIGK